MHVLFFIYPLLLAMYPVVRVFAANMNKLVPSALPAPLLIALGIGLGLSALAIALYRHVQRGLFLAGSILLTSAVLGPFLLMGERSIVGKYIFEEYAYACIGLLVVAFGVLGWKLRSWKYLREGTQVITVIAVALVVSPGVQVGAYVARHAGFMARLSRSTAPAPRKPVSGTLPDIYYIIPDGYGREDVLRKHYHYDNSAFTNFLKARGFYVAEQSRSNYPYTFLSIASSLNMAHLNHLDHHPDQEAEGTQMVLQNKVMKELKQRGYTIIHLNSGWVVTGVDMPLADINFNYRSLNEFTVGIMKSTLLRFFFSDKFYVANQREIVLYQLAKVRDIASMKEPTFTFVHMVCPHPPFVFDRKGNPLPRPSKFKNLEADWLPAQRYVDQLAYLTGEIQKLIDHLLKESKTPPVIILQSDHGPACPNMTAHPAWQVVWQRTGILNAYYVPEAVKAGLYQTITPVNSFRVVLNGLFGKTFALLPDKSYYAGPIGVMPYTFTDVTQLPAN